jgi:molybdate transport system substrate-binding protein
MWILNYRCTVWLLGALCVGTSLAAGLRARAPQRPVSMIISAAASLRDALTEIDHEFEHVQPGVRVELNSGASGTLEMQIEKGAPADAFISAAPEQMNMLAAKGLLLPGTRVDLLRNELVLIVPKESRSVAGFRDLDRTDVRIVAMGDPRTVPAGIYAQQALTALGIYTTVKSKAVLATDVRQVLADVETGSADAGLVYATDAAISRQVRVVAAAPVGTHEAIVYPAAVLRAASHPDAARAYISFLRSAVARMIFSRYGFLPVT